MQLYSSNSSISSASSLADLLLNVYLASPNPSSSSPSPFFFCLDEDEDDDDAAEEEGERLGAGFLDECGMCRQRMEAGKEAYMYGGETAFCSEECRRERMEMDSEAETRWGRATARRCASMKRVADVGGVRVGAGTVAVG